MAGMRPFSCGSQFADWTSSNCDRCTKAADDKLDGQAACTIELALWNAYFGSGEVTPDIARRMGATPENEGRYVWPCGEVEWTEEWKAEYRRLHPEAAP
jgi:hypothetical protein